MYSHPASDAQLRSELDKIRKGLPAPATLVSTYTYIPEVGVSSETDPSGKTTYYEYDGAGRLITIKDQDGKILKHFNYLYQSPN